MRRSLLAALLLLALSAPGASAKVPEPVNAPNPPGAAHLLPGAFKRVGETIVCGRVDGRWMPGTRRLSYWFFTHVQSARNAARAQRPGLARAFRRRARTEAPACGPLRFRLRGAVGLAVHGKSAPRAGHLSNLEVITRTGKVRAAITSGSANVSRIYQAPNGKVYVLFTQSTQIGGGEPTGKKICYDEYGDVIESRGVDEEEDPGADEAADPEQDSGDGGYCEDELTPVVYCTLAELDADGEPTCVDPTLYGVALSGPRGVNDPIQFDDSGAIYYASSGYPSTVLKRYLDGKITSYISDTNVLVDNYLALGNGDVLLTGATISTGARWVRRIDLDGHVHSVRSVSSNFMRLFGDGNAYLGFFAGRDMGVRRFTTATSTLEPRYWIGASADRSAADVDNDITPMCASADAGVSDAFCVPRGSRTTDSVTTSDKRVYVVAGNADGGRLMQYFPEVKVPPTGVAKVSVTEAIGEDLALAGVDADERRVLVLHDTATDAETTLIGPDAEFDVYHLTYDEKTNKLMFDGLRFADNTFVLGDVDLATNTVTFAQTSTRRWTDLQALR